MKKKLKRKIELDAKYSHYYGIIEFALEKWVMGYSINLMF